MNKAGLKKGRIALIILCAVIVVLVAGIWGLSVMIYNDNFDKRFESYEPLMFQVADFDGLQRRQYQFPSDQGQMLTGYMYSAGSGQRGIVVMAHGFGGGGHNSYMDCANYFAQNGYYVFAYDATGNDESEGSSVGGLPQGVIDLEYAISFVKQNEDFAGLPIVLFGHSWGGYSVCSVLTYHPDVKAVISCSGFNRSSDMFESEGKKMVGDGIYLMLPFVKVHEVMKYGDYASNTAMDGFTASDAAVMVVHSADDETVPMEYGYDIYYEAYKDDPRFSFIPLEENGHNYVYCDTGYIDQFNAGFDAWLETLDYDHQAEENSGRFIADKADYIQQNLDRQQWSDMLDGELFAQFVKFFDENLAD